MGAGSDGLPLPPPGLAPARYHPQLDGLRAIAALAVCWTHLLDPGSVVADLGVRLFFVLSGFLITGMLLDARDAGERSPLNFYIRRALRLWPAYYLLLAVLLVLDVGGVRSVAWWHLLYASNVLFAVRGDFIPWPAAPFWSLAVEEQFYLLWPLAVLGLPRRLLPWLCLACLPAALAFRMWTAHAGYPDFVRMLLPGSIDALALGALLAWSRRRGQAARWPLAALAVGLIGWAWVDMTGRGWSPVSGTVTMLVFAGLVDFASRDSTWWPGRLLRASPLVAVGRVSYGVYLYHMPVWAGLIWLHAPLAEPGLLTFGLATSLTLTVAALSWRFIERPANGRKIRFPFPRTARC